jgi:hypothetical protein
MKRKKLCYNKRAETRKNAMKEQQKMEPREGILTFMAEGNNISNSRHYSRKIHWPGVMSKCNGCAK